jgi:flagellar motor protein MotB
LKKTADTVIGEMSAILNDADLGGYQVLVVGHTDDVPLARSRVKYGSNIMLSAFRANSVRKAMVGSGMNNDRIRIAGDGANDPIVPNVKGGTVQNRRVEIFLVAKSPAPEATPTATATVGDGALVKPTGK